jgi:fructose-1,6-bisphosphatase/inositol monophosphatase family enzyme
MTAAETEAAVTSEMLELAQLLADEAAKVTTPLFRAKLVTDIKDDQTPVTEADREAERLMREMVREKLPSHSVFGEEYGYDPGFGGEFYSHDVPTSTYSYFFSIISLHSCVRQQV